MRNLPNYITVGRLLSLPVLVPWCWSIRLGRLGQRWAFTTGCLTDWLDGYIARRFKFESAFGKFLDPVADKIFIATVLITLLANGNLPWWGLFRLFWFYAVNFGVRIARIFGPQNIQFPVSNLAKWKTTAQMFSLGFLIMGEHGETVFPPNWEIGYSFLLIATILTMMTGWIYLKEGIKHLDA